MMHGPFVPAVRTAGETIEGYLAVAVEVSQGVVATVGALAQE